MGVMESFRDKFGRVAEGNGLLAEEVAVRVKPLTTKQAIGTPDRDDFPLQKGKERILEATFRGSAGQAFTDSFRDYQTDVAGLLALDLADRFNASVFVAAANAVLRHLGLARGTVHCRDKEPGLCAPRLVEYLVEHHPRARKVALVGLQPAMAEALGRVFELAVLDLDPDNIGKTKAGALIHDGRTELEPLAAASDLVVATGSTLSNHSMDGVLAAARGKPVVLFGITVSGAASLLGLERFCPLGH